MNARRKYRQFFSQFSPLNGKNFKVHLDGMNLLPFLKGEAKESPRSEFFYWSDDGDLIALRYRDWKVAFLEQNTEISPKTPMSVWTGQFTTLRTPKIYNLRADPFERGPAQAVVASRLELQGVPASRKGGEFHRQRCNGEDHFGGQPE